MKLGGAKLWLLAPGMLLALVPAPAAAEGLPIALMMMIREAKPAERKPITDVAKRLYPDSIDEIDGIVKDIDEDERGDLAGIRFSSGWQAQTRFGREAGVHRAARRALLEHRGTSARLAGAR